MKMFSLTEGELGELALLKGLSALCFSGASAALGFWISVKQAIAFSDKLAPITLATWDTWTMAALIAANVLALAGIALIWRGHSRLNAIKAEMEHDD